MRNTLRRLVSLTPATKNLLTLYGLTRSNNFLAKHGWINTVNTKMPVDAIGHPIPWITYPALAFLEGRINRELSIFEFGSGNSTFWWSERSKNVVSCEHDKLWYDRMRSKMPSNVRYLYRDLNEAYSTAHVEQEEHYDIVVIDGRRRVECAMNILPTLTCSGVVLWDNSERDRYQTAYTFLKDNEFRRLDFWGFGPINFDEWCTSVFYRTENCLGI